MSLFGGPVAVNVSILCFTVAWLISKDSVDHHLYLLFSHKFTLGIGALFFLFFSYPVICACLLYVSTLFFPQKLSGHPLSLSLFVSTKFLFLFSSSFGGRKASFISPFFSVILSFFFFFLFSFCFVDFSLND